MERAGKLLQERLNEVFRAMRETEKFVQEMLNKLERAIAFDAIHGPVENLKNKYKETAGSSPISTTPGKTS